MTLVALLLPSEAHRDARALALCVRGFRAHGLSWAGSAKGRFQNQRLGGSKGGGNSGMLNADCAPLR
jgi:hypothetical protein